LVADGCKEKATTVDLDKEHDGRFVTASYGAEQAGRPSPRASPPRRRFWLPLLPHPNSALPSTVSTHGNSRAHPP
jgi:hypothetical protein